MKNLLLILIFCLSFISCNTNSDKGIKISCSIKNSEQEYVSLVYVPRFRGVLNYDGFKSISSSIDSKGNLYLHANKITNAANYALIFKKTNIPLILFNGDNIHLAFDINNPEKTIEATGKGAGKINVLNLEQFSYNNFNWEKYKSLNEFSKHTNNVISEQNILLSSIYFKKQNDKIISNAPNKSVIQKIITDSPLTKKEYNFLLNRINFQRYSLLTTFLSKMSGVKSLDSIEINFKNDAFKYFNRQEYQKLEDTNDWHFGGDLESIISIEYLKKITKQRNIKITYGNWQSLINNSDDTNWVSSFLKDNFNNRIYTKYYADMAAWDMTLGFDYKNYYKKIETNNNNKYVKRLNDFKNLLKSGLSDEEYNLNENKLLLDKLKFESLLEEYKGRPLFIVFWSAQYAGSSIINNLQAIKSFEAKNNKKVSVINICIDKGANKNLWAARIIDNSWKSKHYFLQIEGNDYILNKFSDKKIEAFCSGGVTYAYINKKGIINSAVDLPFHLSVKDIEKIIE